MTRCRAMGINLRRPCTMLTCPTSSGRTSPSRTKMIAWAGSLIFLQCTPRFKANFSRTGKSITFSESLFWDQRQFSAYSMGR